MVEEEERLIIIGQLGSGKTTLCKKVAIDCDSGKLKADKIVIFIPFKKFAENTRLDNTPEKLFNSIGEEFAKCDLEDRSLQTVLNKGRTLILLDGLDEVSEEYIEIVISTIKKFIDDYFKNQFIITCRSDEVLYDEPELQDFLIWIEGISNSISSKSSYKTAAIRAFYFSRSFTINYDDAIDNIRRYDLAPTLEPSLAIADTLNLDPQLAKDLNDAREIEYHLATALSIVSEDKIALELVKLFVKLGYHLDLQEVIPALLKIRNHFDRSELDDLFDIEIRFKKWWRIKRRNWAEELLYSVKSLPDDLTRKWNFNERQKKLLQKYYNANRLLVEQMNQSEVSLEVRQEIEDSLLLPARSI